MKKTYMTPATHVENAWPTNLICESFKSNVDLTSSGTGSDGEARTQEWNMWGEDE